MADNNLKKVLLKVLLKIDIKNSIKDSLFYIIFNESLFYIFTLLVFEKIQKKYFKKISLLF